jgi:hypothetical protein
MLHVQKRIGTVSNYCFKIPVEQLNIRVCDVLRTGGFAFKNKNVHINANIAI